MSQYVSRILTPYARDTPSFIENAQHFRELIADLTISEDEVLVSFDVKSLFTSVPVEDALTAVKEIIAQDNEFETRNQISAETLIAIVKTCLSTTSFQFKNQHYELTDGLAMGSPLSPAVANIFMSRLERTPLAQLDAEERPKSWFRYVDDVFSIIRRRAVNSFLLRLNEQHP